MIADDEGWCVGYEKGYTDALNKVLDELVQRQISFEMDEETTVQKSHLREISTIYEFVKVLIHSPRD